MGWATFMIRLRKAQAKDLALLKSWDTKPHVRATVPEEYWNWEEELPRDPEWREQLIAEEDGVPIGFIQIIDPDREETHYWGGIGKYKRAIDIWIGEEEYLGKGYGTEMIHQALERCFADPQVEEVLVDPVESNEAASRFYQKPRFSLPQALRHPDEKR